MKRSLTNGADSSPSGSWAAYVYRNGERWLAAENVDMPTHLPDSSLGVRASRPYQAVMGDGPRKLAIRDGHYSMWMATDDSLSEVVLLSERDQFDYLSRPEWLSGFPKIPCNRGAFGRHGWSYEIRGTSTSGGYSLEKLPLTVTYTEEDGTLWQAIWGIGLEEEPSNKPTRPHYLLMQSADWQRVSSAAFTIRDSMIGRSSAISDGWRYAVEHAARLVDAERSREVRQAAAALAVPIMLFPDQLVVSATEVVGVAAEVARLQGELAAARSQLLARQASDETPVDTALPSCV